MSITSAQIKKLFPKAKPALVNAVVAGWPTAEAAYITSPERISQFLANIGVETGGLTAIEENLNYTAERIRQVWPSRFKSVAAARPYAGQPAKLANKVYGSRLGNKGGSDGWDFRGGGMLQTTGRENYRKQGFEHNPDGLREPVQAFATAVREWKNRGCNALADNRATAAIRKKINGGYHGLDQVQEYLIKARVIFAGYKPGSTANPVPATKPAPKPEPAPAPAFVVSKAIVAEVQSMLFDLGYTEVGSKRPDGTFDGVQGALTDAAILAYRNERGVLPIVAAIDKTLFDNLVADKAAGWKRKLMPARTEATPTEVASKVPEANANWWGRIMSGVSGFFSAISAVVFGALQYFGIAKETVDKLKEYAADVPGEVWLAAIAVIMIGSYLLHQRGLTKSTEAFHTAARR